MRRTSENAKRLRELRRSKGFSAPALALVAGVSSATIDAIERHGYIPRQKAVIDRLAKVLGDEVYALFREEGGDSA